MRLFAGRGGDRWVVAQHRHHRLLLQRRFDWKESFQLPIRIDCRQCQAPVRADRRGNVAGEDLRQCDQPADGPIAVPRHHHRSPPKSLLRSNQLHHELQNSQVRRFDSGRRHQLHPHAAGEHDERKGFGLRLVQQISRRLQHRNFIQKFEFKAVVRSRVHQRVQRTNCFKSIAREVLRNGVYEGIAGDAEQHGVHRVSHRQLHREQQEFRV